MSNVPKFFLKKTAMVLLSSLYTVPSFSSFFFFFFELQKIYQFHADFMPMIAENDKTLSANCFFDSSFFQMMYLYDIVEGASAQFLICSFLV